MRKAILLLALAAGGASADDDGVSKALGIAKAGPAAARDRIPELIAISKRGPLERFAARDALVVAGPPAITPLLEGASGDGSLKLLLEGVSFDLGAGVVAPALAALSHESGKVRAMAAVSLGAAGKGGEAAVKQLVALLHDKDLDARREAAKALGGIGRGAHDAVPGLIHLANDPERGCTREAILALGMIVRDAAERARPAPKVAPEVASAIEKGLAWLLRQQRPDGSWVPEFGPKDPNPGTDASAYVTSLVVLAMLEAGTGDRHAARLRSALFALLVADARVERPALSWPCREQRVATFATAARILGEPECGAAAARLSAALAEAGASRGPQAWSALASWDARFAGLRPRFAPPSQGPTGPAEEAIVLLAAGHDPDSPALRAAIEACGSEAPPHSPFSSALAARARWYAGVKSDALIGSVLSRQREDGSWEAEGNPWGPAHATACMLLALEAASGLSRPLTLPLPDAPQLRAAVATLRVAAESKDESIRSAAEQALAGFGR